MASPYIYYDQLTATSSGTPIPLTASMLGGAEGDIVVVVSVDSGEAEDVYLIPAGKDVDAPSPFLAPNSGTTTQMPDFYNGGTDAADRPHLYAAGDTTCRVTVYRANFGNY